MVLHMANNFNGLYVPEPLYVYHEDANITANRAMMGHYCTVLQMLSLLREGSLKPSVGAYRVMVAHVMKVICLAPVCLWPPLYQRTLCWRENLRIGNHGLLSEDQAAFLLRMSALFPIASGVS